jgi:hypothetical protein
MPMDSGLPTTGLYAETISSSRGFNNCPTARSICGAATRHFRRRPVHPVASPLPLAQISPTHTGKYYDSYSTSGIRSSAPLATLLVTQSRACFFLGLNDPRVSRVRFPHIPAVYRIGIHRAAYSSADGRLIRQYTPAATYIYYT